MKYKTFNTEGISCKVPLDTPIIFTRNNNRFGWHLATNSKEEQSQRIMMEQVDKQDLVSDCCGADFDAFGRTDENGNPAEVCNKCGKDCDVHWGVVGKHKQDKPVCKHKWHDVGNGIKECIYCWLKTYKPIPNCEHKLSNIETHDQDGTFHINGERGSVNYATVLTIDYIHKLEQSPPIEDTNKTRLEVPSKIPQMDFDTAKMTGRDISVMAIKFNLDNRDKINSIIDYLTLISLDKKCHQQN